MIVTKTTCKSKMQMSSFTYQQIPERLSCAKLFTHTIYALFYLNLS